MPAAVGVPEITPTGLIVRPVGSPVAVNAMGAVPVAVQAKLYGTPTVPADAGAALVIVGATAGGGVGVQVTRILAKLAP